MITASLQVTVVCDACAVGLTTDPDNPAGAVAAVFADRPAALGALAAAPGWALRLGGRLRCPRCAAAVQCADRVQCLSDGHDYGHLPSGGWQLCACGRSLPGHAGASPDPAGGEGCAMTWRVCSRCEHIEEHHVTEHDDTEVQPGGHLRQDVPAGLALPNHQKSSEENAMVEPTPATERELVPDEGAILGALRNLNLPALTRKFKEGWVPRWVLGTGRDGRGWRTQLELPPGVTVEMINDRKAVLAHNLVRLPVEVWPTEPKNQPGVLDLWVADQGLLTGQCSCCASPRPLVGGGR